MISKCDICGKIFDSKDGGTICQGSCKKVFCPKCECESFGENEECRNCLKKKIKMTYKQALAEGKRVGVSHASEPIFIAQLCETFKCLHPGAKPELVYNGAIKKGLTAKQLAKLANESPTEYGDLMFV